MEQKGAIFYQSHKVFYTTFTEYQRLCFRTIILRIFPVMLRYFMV